MPRLNKFTKEEFDLIQEAQSDAAPNQSNGLYPIIGGITAFLPVYLFIFIQHVDVESNAIILVAVSVVAAWMLSRSYEQVAAQKKPHFEKSVTAGVADTVDSKDASKEQRSEIIRKKAQKVADEQASAYAMFSSNVLFLGIVIFLSFVMFVNLSIPLNFVLSVLSAAGVVLLHSS